MRPRLAAAGTLLLLGLCARDGDAARRRFAWLWDTDVVAERGVELEWWAWERAGYHPSEAVLYVATVFGLTDTIELAVPLEVVWWPGTGESQLDAYGVDLRWRLASPDPAKAGPVVALVRIGARRAVAADAARLEGDVVVSFDLRRDLVAVLDVGAVAVTGGDGTGLGTFGAGASYAVADELRVGVEVYGEATLRGPGEHDAWVTAGPNLSFTHGRFWVTAALPIGLHRDAPDFLPRVVWATAF